MKVNSLAIPYLKSGALIEASNFVMEQLNLNEGQGDFEIYSTTPTEIVIRNNMACSTFCTKKESCDVKFCNQRLNELQRGVSFIDNKILLALMSCANLEDGYCEVCITISF